MVKCGETLKSGSRGNKTLFETVGFWGSFWNAQNPCVIDWLPGVHCRLNAAWWPVPGKLTGARWPVTGWLMAGAWLLNAQCLVIGDCCPVPDNHWMTGDWWPVTGWLVINCPVPGWPVTGGPVTGTRRMRQTIIVIILPHFYMSTIKSTNVRH